MNKPKIIVTITKEDSGYSAHALVDDISVNTQGETLEELKEMVLDAVNLSFEDKGFVFTEDELTHTYDLESFFEFYKVLNAKALSKRIGMNQSLLSQYINGIKKPSANQTKRILKGVQQIGKELSEVRFLL
jgi:predicted RNase H-like HicB family nuclease